MTSEATTQAPGGGAAPPAPQAVGKPTIVGMLPRFHDSSAGRVLVDGVGRREFGLQGLLADLAKRGEAEAGATKLALRVEAGKGVKKNAGAKPRRRA